MDRWAAIAKRIRVPAGFAFSIFYFWLARPRVSSLAAGTVFVLLGLSVRAIAAGYVRKNEALTTDGPYAYVRNPLYLGSVIIVAGFVLASRSALIAAAALILFVLIYGPVILSEEAFLRARFPEYDRYAEQVPRLWPRFKAFGISRIPFSWDLYTKHREYNAILGAAGMMAALVTKMIWLRN